MRTRGTLFLVVGPSGAGKDTLIRQARELIASNPLIEFSRRCITRRPDPYGENHQPLSALEFQDHVREGGFMLHWKAYGFCYGIPKSNYDALSSGQSVVANVSRSVISQARLLYQPLTIIHVTASRDILQKRLTKRGRENDINIDSRLRYANQIVPVGNDVVTIHNNSLLMDATRKFIDVLNTNTCAPPENQSATGR